MIFSYARVSTQEQETHLQIHALHRAGVTLIYQEKRSGGDRKRPVLAEVLSLLQPVDTLVVFKLDRIARSLSHLLDILDEMESKGARFQSLTEVIDTKSPAGRMMMQVIGAFAEFERELIRERTRVGMKAAADRGVLFGRAQSMTPANEATAVRRSVYGESLTSIARDYGGHMSSVKRAVRRVDAQRLRWND